MSPKKKTKTTYRKPPSLFPLDFNEALSALLKVKPAKSKEEMDKAIKKDEKKKKKPDN